MVKVSELLNNRMKELHLTVDQVAECCGVNRATVYRWINGDIDNMRRSNIASLAKILDLDPALIVGNLDDSDVPVPPRPTLPEFKTAQEAIKFMLEVPMVEDFGGYDLNRMTDEQLINFATEVAGMIQVMSGHYPRKAE